MTEQDWVSVIFTVIFVAVIVLQLCSIKKEKRFYNERD